MGLQARLGTEKHSRRGEAGREDGEKTREEKGDHSSAKVTSERHRRSTPGEAPGCLSWVAPPHPCPSPFLSHHSAWDPALRRPLLDNLLAPTWVSRPYLRREQVLHATEDTLIPSEADP